MNRIGSAANFQGSELDTIGVTNDVISNFNAFSIILFGPILNVSNKPIQLSDKPLW